MGGRQDQPTGLFWKDAKINGKIRTGLASRFFLNQKKIMAADPMHKKGIGTAKLQDARRTCFHLYRLYPKLKPRRWNFIFQTLFDCSPNSFHLFPLADSHPRLQSHAPLNLMLPKISLPGINVKGDDLELAVMIVKLITSLWVCNPRINQLILAICNPLKSGARISPCIYGLWRAIKGPN